MMSLPVTKKKVVALSQDPERKYDTLARTKKTRRILLSSNIHLYGCKGSVIMVLKHLLRLPIFSQNLCMVLIKEIWFSLLLYAHS